MMSKQLAFAFFGVLLSLAAGSTRLAAQVGHLTVDQVFIPSVTVTDPREIRFFLNELLISEERVDRIEILDVSRNGFGEKDLVRTYPSGELYFVFPSDTVQSLMDRWEFEANYQIVADSKDTTYADPNRQQEPQGRILASLLSALNQNYAGTEVKLRLERTASDVVFEMWGYDASKLKLPPVAEEEPFDILFVYKTVVDTVFVPVAGVGSQRE